MKHILNDSLQSLQVCLITPKGNKMYRLNSKESIVVPSSFISEMAKKLVKRRLLKITEYK